MSIFNKLNQIKDLRQQAKTLQNQLSGESVTVEKHGLTLTIDGTQKITKLNLPTDYLSADKKSSLEGLILDAHSEALNKLQKNLSAKLKNDPNFKLPQF